MTQQHTPAPTPETLETPEALEALEDLTKLTEVLTGIECLMLQNHPFAAQKLWQSFCKQHQDQQNLQPNPHHPEPYLVAIQTAFEQSTNPLNLKKITRLKQQLQTQKNRLVKANQPRLTIINQWKSPRTVLLGFICLTAAGLAGLYGVYQGVHPLETKTVQAEIFHHQGEGFKPKKQFFKVELSAKEHTYTYRFKTPQPMVQLRLDPLEKQPPTKVIINQITLKNAAQESLLSFDFEHHQAHTWQAINAKSIELNQGWWVLETKTEDPYLISPKFSKKLLVSEVEVRMSLQQRVPFGAWLTRLLRPWIVL